MKKILFLDRDGVILQEPPQDFQIDALSKTSFVPGAISHLSKIAADFGFHHVLVTNQDGLGTEAFPEADFFPYQDLMLRTLEGEGFVFDEVCIDRSFAADPLPTRKPGTGLLTHYLNNPQFDVAGSYVVGDRWSDLALARNLGAKAIYFASPLHPMDDAALAEYADVLAYVAKDWTGIYQFLKLGLRQVKHSRYTKETQIDISLNLDGSGKAQVHTGLGFFDHMLDQIARHGHLDLDLQVKGDLHVDEHHTIEDTGIALGEAFALALSDKRGLQRYGYALPMDDAAAQVLLDFGGRNWLVWEAEFKREKIGEMPTEMFFHFFKSFSDGARCNLNIQAQGENEHHKIEAIFKAFAKAVRMAVKRDPYSDQLPSTKGVL